MKTIIYVEDSWQEFEVISKLLRKKDYQVIPNNKEEFSIMSKGLANGNVWSTFLETKILQNKDNIGVILMDLKFGDKNNLNGTELIQRIRNELTIKEDPFFASLVPIIAVTNHTEDMGNGALDNGATHNIPKDKIFNYDPKSGELIGLHDHIHFVKIIKSMIGYFNKAYKNKNFEKWFEQISSSLLEQNKLVKTGFDNLDITIQSNHNETISKFDLLFIFLFESLNYETKERIFNKFKDELSKIIEPESIEKLENGLWERIKDAIKEVNQGGGFKTFVDTIYETLNEADILGNKGKLVGIAIKGMFGVLASMK